MDDKIALEEHFAIPETLDTSRQYAVDGAWSELHRRLLDLDDLRLAEMDRHGIALAILSLNAPGIQAIPDREAAVATAKRANDRLADAVRARPARFAGFAALPMQDPAAAATELIRSVAELGFKGALVNGFSEVGASGEVVYYDDPAYDAFWASVERLNVPFYLHPRDPLPAREPIYDGHPWLLGPVWAFGAETAAHALRLMSSGLFDRHPRLTIVLGHLGEGLPYSIWRVDHRLAKSSRGMPAQRKLGEYLRSNFYLTTSGNFHTPTLVSAMTEVGAERLLFSVDYPFENHQDASTWFDAAEISESDRLKIGQTNAIQLFGFEMPRKHQNTRL
jgi:predicted TIM-barrel fold metal-dependent hydrolase